MTSCGAACTLQHLPRNKFLLSSAKVLRGSLASQNHGGGVVGDKAAEELEGLLYTSVPTRQGRGDTSDTLKGDSLMSVSFDGEIQMP